MSCADRGLIIPVMERVLGPYLRGGGAKAFNFSALSQDLLAATLEIPFSVPPYMSLLARSVATLEGIALTGDPNYQMVTQVGHLGQGLRYCSCNLHFKSLYFELKACHILFQQKICRTLAELCTCACTFVLDYFLSEIKMADASQSNFSCAFLGWQHLLSRPSFGCKSCRSITTRHASTGCSLEPPFAVANFLISSRNAVLVVVVVYLNV